MTGHIQIHVIVSQPFEENTYLVWRSGRKDALVIDPGLQPELILKFLKKNELAPVAILNTHGHADHIGGNEIMKQVYPDAPLLIGTNDAPLLTDANANLSAPFGMPILSPPADQTLKEGDTIDFAGIHLEVLDIPGHSPGHIAFIYRDNPIIVFGGDVLFRGSIGRFDFPNSNGPLLIEGIRSKLLTLPPDTIIYPGHGPSTTIRLEKQHNPFVGDGAI